MNNNKKDYNSLPSPSIPYTYIFDTGKLMIVLDINKYNIYCQKFDDADRRVNGVACLRLILIGQV